MYNWIVQRQPPSSSGDALPGVIQVRLATGTCEWKCATDRRRAAMRPDLTWKIREAERPAERWEPLPRRRFMRTIACGSLYVLSGGETMVGASGDDPRLVQGELKSWRSDPRLKKLEPAFRFLERPDLKDLPVGKQVIDGEEVYAMVDKSASLAPESVRFEAHKKYTDVHYMISGQVTTGYAPIEKLQLHTPYSEKTEAALYHVPAGYLKLKLYPGMFAVFFPGGGHMPNCHLDGQHDLHKVVVKVRHHSGTA